MRLHPSDKDHRAMTDFAADTRRVVQHVRDTGRPVVLTSDGQEVAVLLSFESFEEMRSAVEEPRLQRAIEDAEQGIEEGRWVEHAEVEAKLKRWAAGDS